jgi:rRNA maturation RNase YbeY
LTDLTAPTEADDCPVGFFYEELADWTLPNAEDTAAWLQKLASHHRRPIDELTVVFVTDAKLRELNNQFLGHDYETDILTFDYSEPGAPGLFGELYISVERVRDNAPDYGASFDDELHRVLAHGLLHLLGFDDQTDEDTARMRQAEDQALSLR